jgi:hypothetical protein
MSDTESKIRIILDNPKSTKYLAYDGDSYDIKEDMEHGEVVIRIKGNPKLFILPKEAQ